MTIHFWTRKGLVLSVAVVMLAVFVGAAALGVAQPEPVSSAALGPDWQCTRLAFLLTTCRKPQPTQVATAIGLEDRNCPRRAILVERSER